MEEIILFLLTFLTVLIIYEVFIVSKTKKKKAKKKDKVKEPTEVLYLVNRYKLDMKKVDYNQLLQIVALVSSLDIAIVVSIMAMFDNFFLEIMIGMVGVLVTILISYHLVYLFYKKKGMILDD